MTRHVAVIDLGKSNSKVALVDTVDATELEVLTAHSATRDDGPYPSLHDRAIQLFIESSLCTLARTSPIDALTVTAHGATAALIDAVGNLTLPVMDYECEMVDELSGEYDAVRPAFAETGSPRLPGGLNIGAQLFWQKTRYPREFARTTSVLVWPQYWVYKLCGMRCNDVSSLGAHTDLYDPHRKRFSSLVDNQHWRPLMPTNEPSGKAIGWLSESLREKLGINHRTPVHVGIHDSNASLVPHLLGNSTAFSVVSTGTWTICMSVGGDSVDLNESRDCLYNVNAFGEPVASARFMGGRERELLLQQDSPVHAPLRQRPMGTTATATTTGQRDAAYRRLLNHPPEHAALLLPGAVKGAGPYPHAHAAWIDADTTVDSVQRAGDSSERECIVSLYLALMSAECLSLIGSRGPIYVEGPSAHDPVYTQMLSVTTGRPVLISHSVTGTSVGAAMLIARPQNMPVNTAVKCDATVRLWLTGYASRWRHALSRHVRV